MDATRTSAPASMGVARFVRARHGASRTMTTPSGATAPVSRCHAGTTVASRSGPDGTSPPTDSTTPTDATTNTTEPAQ